MPSRAEPDKGVVLVDVRNALRSDSSQFAGVALERNGGQSPDRDMGVAGVEFPAGSDTVRRELAPQWRQGPFRGDGPLCASPV